MLITTAPLKFECSRCYTHYYHHCTQHQHDYPECPHCHKKGLLIGRVETHDFFKHPFLVTRSMLKWSLHRLNKQR